MEKIKLLNVEEELSKVVTQQIIKEGKYENAETYIKMVEGVLSKVYKIMVKKPLAKPIDSVGLEFKEKSLVVTVFDQSGEDVYAAEASLVDFKAEDLNAFMSILKENQSKLADICFKADDGDKIMEMSAQAILYPDVKKRYEARAWLYERLKDEIDISEATDILNK